MPGALVMASACFMALVGSSGQDADDSLVITNIAADDPENFVLWDKVANKPVEFWTGNYSNLQVISCERTGDLLFDWAALKRGMVKWLRELLRGSDRVKQTYWEEIRPIQHALTNIVAFHNITTTRDCILGMLSVRIFYLVVQSDVYMQHEVVKSNNFVGDWHYFSQKFRWSYLVRSGFGGIIWPSIHVLAAHVRRNTPELSWNDCDALPGAERLIHKELGAAPTLSQQDLLAVIDILSRADTMAVRKCPVAFAYAAAVVSQQLAPIDTTVSLQFLDASQDFIRQYREVNDFTFINLLVVEWPFFATMYAAVDQLASDLGVDQPKVCDLVWCPDGGTPNPRTCECEVIFPQDHPNVTACVFMVDTRRPSSLRNITSVINARFWTLTYGVNRMYVEDHGYEIEYVIPDNQTHFPDRKVGWGKVKVIIDRLREYGPQRCNYGVSMDTDAFFRSSEPLAAVIHHYGLDRDKLILFSQEYHTENRPGNTFANGGFFIVRNSEAGVALLEEWYAVPEVHADMRHLKKENPQGLNLCWDLKMQPRHKDVTVLAPSYLFTAPLGWWVRHNWFKDLRFEQEMIDILLQRLHRKYGCIMCQNVYDWDDSLNTDPGWR